MRIQHQRQGFRASITFGKKVVIERQKLGAEFSIALAEFSTALIEISAVLIVPKGFFSDSLAGVKSASKLPIEKGACAAMVQKKTKSF
jgi:hypothetical protein